MVAILRFGAAGDRETGDRCAARIIERDVRELGASERIIKLVGMWTACRMSAV
jgi:hypothetical protein